MKERLQKVIARAGVASRRKAEQLIRQGRVIVNGKVVTELGFRVEPEDDSVKVDGKRIHPEKLQYYIVNKPAGVLSAAADPSGRPVVTDLVKSSCRLYPAGRLDWNSEGLILLTNDGELTRSVTRCGTLEKRYRVKVLGRPSPEKLQRLRLGIRLEGEKLAPCEIKLLKPGDNSWYQVVLRQGRNRQIRRMFAAIGHPVMRLKRFAIGPIRLGRLRPGDFRALAESELRVLRWAVESRPKRGRPKQIRRKVN